MIIFGTRGKVLSNKNATKKLNCKNYSSQNTVTAFTSFRYFHIFWIPFFQLVRKLLHNVRIANKYNIKMN